MAPGREWFGASRKFDEKFVPNLITVQNFNRSDFLGDHVKYQHPFLRLKSHVPVIGAVCALGFRQYVKRSAKIITAVTSFDHGQSRHLARQFGFALFGKKLLQFLSEFREHINKRLRLSRRHPSQVYAKKRM